MPMSAATIDIVMPFYGLPDHFRIAVESVLAQEDGDWRLLVIDDAYPDESPGRWLQSLDDPRISYRRNQTNAGINANFQASLDAATAEWVVIFGCDDRMLPGYLSAVRRLIAAYPETDLVHPGVRIIDDRGSVSHPLVDVSKRLYRGRVRGTRLLQGEEFATSITRGNWMYFPAIAWRRSSAARFGFRPGLDVAQDLALALDIAMNGGSLVVDETIEFEYRRHAGSVSSWRAVDGSRFLEERSFFADSAERFRVLGWNRAARAAAWHLSSRINALTRLPGAIRSGQPGAAVLLGHAFGIARRGQPGTTR